MTSMDRRTFIARGAAAAGGAVAGSTALASLTNRMALADLRTACRSSYGPPERMADQLGRYVLALPAGFSYVTFGEIGSPMSDGTPTPLALDGMAAFRGPRGTVRLIRNHEDRNAAGRGSVAADPAAKYDPQAGAGTVTLDYDPCTRTLVRSYVSLAGTTVNCAGGYRPAPPQLAERRGDDRRPGELRLLPAARLHVRGAREALARRPADRRAAEGDGPVLARGIGHRPAHRASCTSPRIPAAGSGAGFYRFVPQRSVEPRCRRAATDPRDRRACPTTTRVRARSRGGAYRSPGSTSPTPIRRTRTCVTRAASSSRAGRSERPCSTGSRAAGGRTAACSSSPPAAATSRTATSTPTGSARDTARSGSTARITARAGSSSCTTSRPAARCSTRPTISRSRPAAASCCARTTRRAPSTPTPPPPA